MALIQRYINVNSPAGGDGTTSSTGGPNRAYSSLSEWDAAENTNLVADGDSHQVECAPGEDTSNTVVSGNNWTTDATHTLRIYAADNAKNNGVPLSGYYINPPTGSPVTTSADYVTYEGIEFRSTNDEAVNVASNSVNVTLNDCILHRGGTSTSGYVLQASGVSIIQLNFNNCIIYGVTRATDTRSSTSVDFNNCTFYGGGTQIGVISTSEATYNNCYVGNFQSGSCFWSGGSPSGNYNASSDASASLNFTNSIDNATPLNQFTDPANGDFSLLETSDLIDFGVDVGVTNDIAGNARDANPDLGAFEFISEGPDPVTGALDVTAQVDTPTITGTVTNAGSLDYLEFQDTPDSTGTITNTGTIDASDQPDDMTAVGTVGDAASGALDVIDQADAGVSTGTLTNTGTIDASDQPDDMTATGNVGQPVTGIVNVTDQSDDMTALGAIGDVALGTLDVIDQADAVVSTGTLTNTGALDYLEFQDTPDCTGTITNTGTIDAAEDPDIPSMTGAVSNIVGSLSTIDQVDTPSIIGQVGQPVTGTLVYTEKRDFTTKEVLDGHFEFTHQSDIFLFKPRNKLSICCR